MCTWCKHHGVDWDKRVQLWDVNQFLFRETSVHAETHTYRIKQTQSTAWCHACASSVTSTPCRLSLHRLNFLNNSVDLTCPEFQYRERERQTDRQTLGRTVVWACGWVDQWWIGTEVPTSYSTVWVRGRSFLHLVGLWSCSYR